MIYTQIQTYVFAENKNMVCYCIWNYRYRFMEYFYKILLETDMLMFICMHVCKLNQAARKGSFGGCSEGLIVSSY